LPELESRTRNEIFHGLGDEYLKGASMVEQARLERNGDGDDSATD
jgi:hypothetical protein